MRATEFTVHDVTGGGDVIVARTVGTEATIRGLAGGVERTFEIVSHNAIGLPSAPSAPIRVTPLDPVMLFAATFGDDAHAEAGSAAHPFRTVRAALVRAAAIDADEICAAKWSAMASVRTRFSVVSVCVPKSEV